MNPPLVEHPEGTAILRARALMDDMQSRKRGAEYRFRQVWERMSEQTQENGIVDTPLPVSAAAMPDIRDATAKLSGILFLKAAVTGNPAAPAHTPLGLRTEEELSPA